MKLSVLQEDLSHASSLALRFVSARAQLPILGNILLKAANGKLILEATNLESGIHIPIGAKVEEEGELTVPAKILVELVQNLPAGRVEISQDKDVLQVSTNNLSASISGIPANGFPKIPNKIDSPSFTLKKEIFNILSKQLTFASGVDESRPILTGIFVDMEKGVIAVATDGFRMSVKDLTKSELIQRTLDKKNFLLPARTIEELGRSLPKDSKEVKVEVKESEGQLIFDADSLVLTARVIEGNFPDYKKVIPLSDGTVVNASKDELARAVKSAGVFARESAGIVKVALTKNGIILTSESAQFGKEKITIEASIKGDETQSAFNYKYLSDFLGSVVGESVEIKTQGPASPAVFQDPKDPTYKHIIMPVRISN